VIGQGWISAVVVLHAVPLVVVVIVAASITAFLLLSVA
jgi:hypothetical protein